jgi:hypothetical protein
MTTRVTEAETSREIPRGADSSSSRGGAIRAWSRSSSRYGAALQESAWIFLSGYGLMLGAVSLLWLLRGQLFDREVYEVIGGMSWSLMKALDAGVIGLVSALVRLGGAMGMVVAAFVIGVATTAYRSGERWSWYVMWTLPFIPIVDLAILAAYNALTLRTIVWDLYMLALALVGLALPYRVFFPAPEDDDA